MAIRGEAAVELCQRVVEVLQPVIPEGVTVDVRSAPGGPLISYRGPEGAGFEGPVQGFGALLPLPPSVQMRLALTQILDTLRDMVRNAVQRQWPPGGKSGARVRMTGNTAILSFAMADGSVFDVGSIAL